MLMALKTPVPLIVYRFVLHNLQVDVVIMLKLTKVCLMLDSSTEFKRGMQARTIIN